MWFKKSNATLDPQDAFSAGKIVKDFREKIKENERERGFIKISGTLTIDFKEAPSLYMWRDFIINGIKKLNGKKQGLAWIVKDSEGNFYTLEISEYMEVLDDLDEEVGLEYKDHIEIDQIPIVISGYLFIYPRTKNTSIIGMKEILYTISKPFESSSQRKLFLRFEIEDEKMRRLFRKYLEANNIEYESLGNRIIRIYVPIEKSETILRKLNEFIYPNLMNKIKHGFQRYVI